MHWHTKVYMGKFQVGEMRKTRRQSRRSMTRDVEDGMEKSQHQTK